MLMRGLSPYVIEDLDGINDGPGLIQSTEAYRQSSDPVAASRSRNITIVLVFLITNSRSFPHAFSGQGARARATSRTQVLEKVDSPWGEKKKSLSEGNLCMGKRRRKRHKESCRSFVSTGTCKAEPQRTDSSWRPV